MSPTKNQTTTPHVENIYGKQLEDLKEKELTLKRISDSSKKKNQKYEEKLRKIQSNLNSSPKAQAPQNMYAQQFLFLSIFAEAAQESKKLFEKFYLKEKLEKDFLLNKEQYDAHSQHLAETVKETQEALKHFEGSEEALKYLDRFKNLSVLKVTAEYAMEQKPELKEMLTTNISKFNEELEEISKKIKLPNGFDENGVAQFLTFKNLADFTTHLDKLEQPEDSNYRKAVSLSPEAKIKEIKDKFIDSIPPLDNPIAMQDLRSIISSYTMDQQEEISLKTSASALEFISEEERELKEQEELENPLSLKIK